MSSKYLVPKEPTGPNDTKAWKEVYKFVQSRVSRALASQGGLSGSARKEVCEEATQQAGEQLAEKANQIFRLVSWEALVLNQCRWQSQKAANKHRKRQSRMGSIEESDPPTRNVNVQDRMCRRLDCAKLYPEQDEALRRAWRLVAEGEAICVAIKKCGVSQRAWNTYQSLLRVQQDVEDGVPLHVARNRHRVTKPQWERFNGVVGRSAVSIER